MNKDDAIAAVLTKALEVADKTGDFVVEQAPDVVNQLVSYYTALSIAGVAVGGSLLLTGVVCIVLGLRDRYGEGGKEFIGGMASLVGMPLLIFSTIELLKLTLAPKIWLMEYAASLIK